MFIPTNSDGQISVNLRKKNYRIKTKKINSLIMPSVFLSRPLLCLFVFGFLFQVGPTCPFFFHFSIIFSPETIYFVPISISFILNEYSLYTWHFSEFF